MHIDEVRYDSEGCDSNLVLQLHVGITHMLNCCGWLEVVEVDVRNFRSYPR